jgi:hypothetical protein
LTLNARPDYVSIKKNEINSIPPYFERKILASVSTGSRPANMVSAFLPTHSLTARVFKTGNLKDRIPYEDTVTYQLVK